MRELQYRDEIYKKAQEVKNIDDLTKFIYEIAKHKNDYSTVVYACSAAMFAAFNVVNRGPNGGVTGFQAGCIGWECIGKFMMIEENAPCRLINYNEMLYPQYSANFEKTITVKTWDYLQNNAAKKIISDKNAHQDVISHWHKIASGVIPFGYKLKAW